MYDLSRGISHQETISNVQKILRKSEAIADLEFGEGITNYTNKYATLQGVVPFVEYIAEKYNSEKKIFIFLTVECKLIQ